MWSKKALFDNKNTTLESAISLEYLNSEIKRIPVQIIRLYLAKNDWKNLAKNI